MLEIKDLSVSISDRYLIKNLNLVLNNGDKFAIIGEEGNGKSTLLKAVLGACEYAEISGKINLKGNKIGYLEQSMNDDDLNKNVYDFLFVNENDYYDKVNNLYKYLELINLNDEILKQKINTLSGGERVKISILKLLLNEYDILFVAVQYWCQKGLPFKLYQVIRLTNQDDISREYRSGKQIIERFNRTLKYYYRPKGGFTSLDNANSYMVLFATYNNFLRPNKAFDWKTPVELDELNGISNMPNKWIELINFGYRLSDVYC